MYAYRVDWENVFKIKQDTVKKLVLSWRVDHSKLQAITTATAPTSWPNTTEWRGTKSWHIADAADGQRQRLGLELELILVLILNHIRSTVDPISAGLFVDQHWSNSTGISN